MGQMVNPGAPPMKRWIAGILVGVSGLVALAQQAAPSPAGDLNTRLQTALDEWRDSIQAPGASLGVVQKDGSVVGLASGLADKTGSRKLLPSQLMMAGSTGKTFFAALALQLIEAGQLDLNAPVAKYLGDRPWFSRLPNAKDITVRHLMTHTSGLVRYEMNPKFTPDLRAQPDKAWTPEEKVAYLLDATPPFAAGQGWDYSDTNYIVLGMILEKLTDTKAYDEIARRFLNPLKLTEVAPTRSRRTAGLVNGYAGAKDPLGLPDEVNPNGVFVINPQFEWAGGGFATSARQLGRWGHALYTAQAISPQMRDLMIAEAVPARLGPETRYGLGVIVRPTTPVGRTWGHSGFFPGYLTELVHLPDRGITLAVQINTSSPARGGRSALRFLYDVAGGL